MAGDVKPRYTTSGGNRAAVRGNVMKAYGIWAAIAAVVLPLGAANAANLLKDGGFEGGSVPPGQYSTFSPGQKMDDWKVIASAAVAPCPELLVSTAYQQDGIAFTARSGKHWLDLGDLSGGSCYNGASEGIQQTVPTTLGASYTLSFWVGSIYDPTTVFTKMPRFYAFQNGVILVSSVIYGVPGTAQQWKQYTASFTATSDRTTISFLAPTLNPQDVGLDDVDLEPAQ